MDSEPLDSWADDQNPTQTTRPLPTDLPQSLDDRKPATYNPGVEYYDAWQGQSQYYQSPATNTTSAFSLSLDKNNHETDLSQQRLASTDTLLDKMLAQQAAHREGALLERDAEHIAQDPKLPPEEKKKILQAALNMAASNGDDDRLQKLLTAPVRLNLDLNAPDDEGTAPLIYAACFGHSDILSSLLNAGARIDEQDRHQWTALMWATANRHKEIVKILLDRGASTDVKSSSGRTAFDFVPPNSDLSDYLHESGYKIGSAGMPDDFYDSGFSQDRFEEEMADNEMKRRMMMESAINLEVDLGNLGIDEQPESPEELDPGHDFVWDKCLNDQMFVFQESELQRILDVIITHMTPQRSPSQKPVPANIIFLAARYAHYHANHDLLELLINSALDKINDVIDRHQWDMTILAFWISNATLLLHYLKKDNGLVAATTEFQLHIAELINEIFVLIIRDAERRMDKVLDASILDHETIPGFEDIHFQNEWKIFRTKTKAKPPEPPEKRFRPPSPKRRARISPRNITSLLSSTLFVLDLYDIHSVITSQVLSQLLYWLGAELFNRTMSSRKYLARTKAMQVRMNVSVLEEWARHNNRVPEHYENGSMTAAGESTIDSARQHLAPIIQLLQWLQIFSSLGDNREALQNTISQLNRLSAEQLLHAVQYYRNEVDEKNLPKADTKYLKELQKDAIDRKAKRRSAIGTTSGSPTSSKTEPPTSPGTLHPNGYMEDDAPEHLLLDPAMMLPFSLPTSTDMLVSYGAGFGGLNKERERKYIPTVPPEFLTKFEIGNKKDETLYDNESFEDD